MKSIHRMMLVALCLLQAMCVSGQGGKHKLANNYMLRYDMDRAAEIFEDIIQRDSTDAVALRKAAICRKNLGQTEVAEQHLGKLVSLENCESSDFLSYAEVLKRNGKYHEAVEAYKRYTELRPDDPRVYHYFEQEDWLHRILRDSSRYQLRNADVNSKYSDFAPNFVGDKVVFSSSRGEGKGGGNKYAWNDQSYLNLYQAEITEDSLLGAVEVLGGKANTRFHEGTAAWDEASGQVYISRNQYIKGKKTRSKSGTLHLGIYVGNYDSGRITGLHPFAYNNDEYSVGHPTITADGNTLYFVSNMPGGMGGTDIYKCTRNEEGWGQPENLGEDLNTGGNEMFPFAMDSALYFASDGLPGLGGLDLFYKKLFDDGGAINLGYPLSTEYDDFNVVLFDNGKRGFFSSNRPSGKGDDDIWEFEVKPATTVIISGKVLDAISMKPLEGVKISCLDKNLATLQVAETDALGRYSFEIDKMEQYEVEAIKEGYVPFQTTFENLSFSRFIDDADISLSPSDFGVRGRVMFSEDDSPAAGAKLSLYDDHGTLVGEMNTPESGLFTFALSGGHQYTIECSKFGFPDQEIALDTRNIPPTIFESDFRLFKLEAGVTVRLGNIYYDYDKYEIRPDAELELNKLVKVLTDNPRMKIELGSHTDSRGSSQYNEALSVKRANVVVEFLLKQGIDKSRIVAKGYGETKILNHCTDGVECSEAEHQMNRRTEFVILEI